MHSEFYSLQEVPFSILPIPLHCLRTAKTRVGFDHLGVEFNRVLRIRLCLRNQSRRRSSASQSQFAVAVRYPTEGSSERRSYLACLLKLQQSCIYVRS